MKQVETVKLLFRASHFEILQFLPFSACRETEPGLRMQLPEAWVVDVEAVSSHFGHACFFRQVPLWKRRMAVPVASGSQLDMGAKTKPQISG